MKKARQKKPSMPRPLSVPTGGTDQELRDALDKAIDPATAQDLRRQFDCAVDNEAFTTRCKPAIVAWMQARQEFHFREFAAFIKSLGGKLMVEDLDGVFHFRDEDDERLHFAIATTFICGEGILTRLHPHGPPPPPEEDGDCGIYRRVPQGCIIIPRDVP